MFSTGYNQGLKVARDAPSILLADLRALEFDSDGEEVHYGDDDNPLPEDPSLLPPTQLITNPSRSPGNDDLISFAPPSPVASVTNSNGVAKE